MNAISKIIDNKKTLSKLIKAFPTELTEDVKTVFKSFPKTIPYNYIFRSISIGGERQFCLITGENVEIPYRLYLDDNIKENRFLKLTPTQQAVYHCIFSLSYDGYVREKHVKSLLNQANIQQWVYPFILKNSSEYVVQILDTVYQCLKDRENTELKAFCKQNLQVFLYYYSRMINYWNEFYRIDCYRYKDYIGKKLFTECFGYSREFEKYRKKYKKTVID